MSRKIPVAIAHIEKVIYGILDKSLEDQITTNSYTARSLNNSKIIRDTVSVKRSINKSEKFTIVIISSFDPTKLKIALARTLVLDIMVNLKMNNPLWYCSDYKKSRYRDALEELEDLQVLKRLRGSGICFVFPNKLRRGYMLDIISSLEFYLNKQRKSLSQVTLDDIVDLPETPGNYELTGHLVRALCS